MKVLLTVCALATLCATACKKSNSNVRSSAEPEHFKLITGVGTWHHEYESAYDSSGYIQDTLADVQLSIGYINPTTIYVDVSGQRDTLTYVSDTNSVLTFFVGTGGGNYYARLGYSYNTGDALFYRAKYIGAAVNTEYNHYYKP